MERGCHVEEVAATGQGPGERIGITQITLYRLQFKATQAGILVLLGFTACMLAAFAAFFIYLRRRIAAAEPEGVTR